MKYSKKSKWDDYENCLNAAKQCRTKTDFIRNFNSAYLSSVKNGWIDTFIFETQKKWNQEDVFNEAKKYKTKVEFQKKSSGAYQYANKHNLINLMTWFVPLKKEDGYWDVKEHCIEESKKYTTRTEFEKGSIGAYIKSRKNGWLEEMTWLTTPLPKFCDYDKRNHVIYAYEIKETNSVYVGLTNNAKRRHYQHSVKQRKKTKSGITYCYDTIMQHCIDNNIILPKPKILEENLNYFEAQEKENEWLEKYKSKGYNVINQGKTGKNVSSIGGNTIVWTTEMLIEEAKKYTNARDFKKFSPQAYASARYRKMFNLFTWFTLLHKPNNYWNNFEHCKEVSVNFKTRSEFRKKYDKAYRHALKNGWLDTLFPLK